MNITKAIIPVAGWGARRLPVTKSVEKCMLPIANRPVIDYVVYDCITAGITDIYFVVNSESTQLRNYYSRNMRLEGYLQNTGKTEYMRFITPPQNVRFHYIEQDATQKYGTAIPVGLGTKYLKQGESVAVMMGDDFLYNPDGSSELARLISATKEGSNSMLSVNMPTSALSRYGVIQFTEDGNYYQLVEKPDPAMAPSTYVNVSKYIFNYDLMKQIEAYAEVSITGEYQLTDPLNQYVLTGGSIQVVEAKGQYLDAGDVHSWFDANRIILGR